MRRTLAAAGAALVVGLMVAGWWMSSAQEVTVDSLGDQVQTLARGRLPIFAEQGDLGRLYAFAAKDADTLQWMPCTCGCGSLGHGSNRACYVKAETASRVTFTSHAAT
jgi:diadenosine tetraphosphatase ApaH/serine/threonine PP2A family protein phosphatase